MYIKHIFVYNTITHYPDIQTNHNIRLNEKRRGGALWDQYQTKSK